MVFQLVHFRIIPVLLLCLFVGHRGDASPIPGVGSSVLVSPEYGNFLTVRKFTLMAKKDWRIESSDTDFDGRILYSNPRFSQAHLTVQSEVLAEESSLESYTKRWMKDYPNYGFDVLGAKTFRTNNAKGLVVDLVHKKDSRQLRQAIFVKERRSVVVTCMDERKDFTLSLGDCNYLIHSFRWLN